MASCGLQDTLTVLKVLQVQEQSSTTLNYVFFLQGEIWSSCMNPKRERLSCHIDDTKLCGHVNLKEDKDILQKDLVRLDQ